MCSLAQTAAATLSGTVTDPSDAVITAATVQLINIDTNVAQTTLTNQAGLYSFASIPPGLYRMPVKHPGFKESVKTDLVLHVGDTVAQNFAMELGATTESLSVSSEAILVNTEDATVGTGPHRAQPWPRHSGHVDIQYRTVRGEWAAWLRLCTHQFEH